MHTRENKTETPLWDSFCVVAVPSSRVAEDSRTAFQGYAILASRGPTAGRDGHASQALRKRHFQQPSVRKPAQPMQMLPATASFPLPPKAAFQSLFCGKHLALTE